MSLTITGAGQITLAGQTPSPSLQWSFNGSNVDSVTNLTPTSQLSPGPAQLQGSAALVTNAPTSNTAVYLPNSVNSYMNMPVDIIPASSNLFVEAWFYNITTTSLSYIMVRNNSTQNLDNSEDWGFRINGTTLQLYNWFSDGSVNVLSSTTSVPVSTWTHIAFIFDITNKNYTIFVNGIASGTTNFTGKTLKNTSTNMATFIGTKYLHTAWSSINAYIRDLRVVQGGVVPTASFTPGSAPFSSFLPSYVTGSGSVVFTLLGQFITYVPGAYGQSIYFPNSATGSSPPTSNIVYTLPSIFTANNFTISTWLKPYFNTASPFSFGNQHALGIYDANSGVSFNMNATDNPYIYVINRYNLGTGLAPNVASLTWFHNAVVFSNVGGSIPTLSYYFNGNLIVSRSYGGSAGPTSFFSSLTVGCVQNSLGGNFAVQDLRLFNTALTAGQVQSIYKQSAVPVTRVSLTGTPLFSQLSSAAVASAMGAFSLRAVNGLSPSGTAKVVNIRNGTTSATQDFYADRLGNLLTVPVTGQTLSSWLGGATGYVATWYDQSGKGNHMSCSSTGLQPKIDTANNWIDFKTSAYFDTSANPTAGPSPWDSTKRYTVTCHHNTVVNTSGPFCASNDVGGSLANKQNAFQRSTANYNNGWNTNPGTGGTYVAGNKVSFKWDGTNRYIYGNGTLQATISSGGWAQTSSADQRIGIAPFNSSINGEMYSIFMFNTALSDADRVLVEAAS